MIDMRDIEQVKHKDKLYFAVPMGFRDYLLMTHSELERFKKRYNDYQEDQKTDIWLNTIPSFHNIRKR